ncbi:MAG: DUF3347 domain-containing protein, partial [Flavobacteriaceae bacterium]|nr:DUF3347 domain-containing protein [Flavobacteriaceae bacterium]
KDALTKDDYVNAEKQAGKVKEVVSRVETLLLQGDAHHVWMKAMKSINKKISVIQVASNIE